MEQEQQEADAHWDKAERQLEHAKVHPVCKCQGFLLNNDYHQTALHMFVVDQQICIFCRVELDALSDTMHNFLIKTLACNPASIVLNAKGIWVAPAESSNSISAFRDRYTNTFCSCHWALADQSIHFNSRNVRFDNIPSQLDEERTLLSSFISNLASYSWLNAIMDELDSRRKDSHQNNARALELYAPMA